MAGKENKSSFKPTPYKGKHLKLSDLKEEARDTYMFKKYLIKHPRNIPQYPGPDNFSPEFRTSYVKHDTDQSGLRGIKKDNGFKDPNDGLNDVDKLSLVWFSLDVKEQEIKSAEVTLLQKSNMQAREPGFLKKFASSPAFSKKSRDGLYRSRYGSYRFTFKVAEVLNAYKEQFCDSENPVMRVLRTTLYQKEVMYAVLVHRPTEEDNNRFNNYPSLSDVNQDAVCTYEEGQFIWRPQAMCDTHEYKLTTMDNQMDAEKINPHEWFVWDHVTLALHVEKQVLRFDSNILLSKPTICEKDEVTVGGRVFQSPNFDQDEPSLEKSFEGLMKSEDS